MNSCVVDVAPCRSEAPLKAAKDTQSNRWKWLAVAGAVSAWLVTIAVIVLLVLASVRFASDLNVTNRDGTALLSTTKGEPVATAPLAGFASLKDFYNPPVGVLAGIKSFTLPVPDEQQPTEAAVAHFNVEYAVRHANSTEYILAGGPRLVVGKDTATLYKKDGSAWQEISFTATAATDGKRRLQFGMGGMGMGGFGPSMFGGSSQSFSASQSSSMSQGFGSFSPFGGFGAFSNFQQSSSVSMSNSNFFGSGGMF